MLLRELKKTLRMERDAKIISIITTAIGAIVCILFFTDDAFYSEEIAFSLIIVISIILTGITYILLDVVPKRDETHLGDIVELIDEAYKISLYDMMDTNLREMTIHDVIGLVEEGFAEEALKELRNKIIVTVENEIAEEDDIIQKCAKILAVTLSVMIDYPYITAVDKDYEKSQNEMNNILMEKVLKLFISKVNEEEGNLNIEAINNVDWNWHFNVALKLTDEDAIKYLYEILLDTL